MASAAQTGVYGPEREWLIEGHGVVPDVVVENLPRATFRGDDAQLEAGVRHLLDRLAAEPVPVPPPPPHPTKAR
jgi:tricorn protease